MIRRTFVQATGAAAAVAAFGLPASAALSPQSVNVINTGANDSIALQELIVEKKYFEQFNLNATTSNVSDGLKLAAAIVSGAADIGMLTGFSQVFPAIENGAGIKLVAGAELKPDFSMYTGNPQVKSLKDLEGKSVGTGAVGAVVYNVAVAMLRKAKVDVSKVTFVNIGSSSDVFKAVAARKIDAGPCQHDFVKLAASQGIRILADANTLVPEFTNQASFTSDRAIAEKREALVRTLAAYGSAYRFVQSGGSQAAYAKAYAAAVGPGTEEAGRDRWTWLQAVQGYDTGLVLAPERIMYLQELNVSLGVQKAVLPLAKVADMTIARDALKLMK